MAATSYGGLSGHDYRRPIGGNYTAAYDTPPSSSRRRSPSPSSSSRRYTPYDSYVPRGGPPIRAEYENNYRPNSWRPGRYHSRSPSPDRFERARPFEPHYGSHWHPSSWDDVRSPSSPPPSASRDKGRRDIMAERMFEPSDAWKQSQTDRPGRRDFSEPSPVDRYSDSRARHLRDFSPPRSATRNEYPPLSGGDSYRPYASNRSYRDSYAFARSDTYRPHYDDEPWEAAFGGQTPPIYQSRSSGTYDRGDVRPPSSARSIASTPPRQTISPIRGDSATRIRYPYSESTRYPPSPPSQQQPLTPPKTRSRGSSVCDEPPRKRFKSRSSSQSSSTSRRGKVDIPVHSHLEVHESQRTIKSPRPTYSTTTSTNLPLTDSNCSTPQDTLNSVDMPHATGVCPSSDPSSHAPLVPSALARDNPVYDPQGPESLGHTTVSSLPTPPLDISISKETHFASPSPNIMGETALNNLIDELSATDPQKEAPATPRIPWQDAAPPEPTAVQDIPMGGDSHLPIVISEVDAEPPAASTLPSPVSRYEGDELHIAVAPEQSHSPKTTTHIISPAPTEAPGEDATSGAGRQQVQPLDQDDPDRGFVNIRAPSHTSEAVVHINSPRFAERPETNVPATTKGLSEVYENRRGCDTELLSSKPVDSNSNPEAFRAVVIARLRCDRQTRSERVLPVIRANQAVSLASPSSPESIDRLFQDVVDGQRSQETLSAHSAIKPSFLRQFAERKSMIAEKSQRLKEEYLALHEKWLAHCARLDNMQKGGTPEESVVPAGRSTRRSAAILGDAVRSDLEMEQIIASLGVEELTDPNYLAIKNVAQIPDMISVTEGAVSWLYDDTNNLVDDPSEFYNSSSSLEYWTEEEQAIFQAEFAARPKQFGFIASRLPNKSPAQCVTYYYLHKKCHVDFRKAVAQYGAGKRRKNGRRDRQKGNGLMADIRRHDDEVSRASPSVQANGNGGGRRKRAAILRPNGTAEPRRIAPRRSAVQVEQTPTSSGTTPDPEPELQKRRRRTTAPARAPAVAGPEEVDGEEQDAERRTTKRSRKPRKGRTQSAASPSEDPATPVPEGLKFIDQTESASRRKPATANAPWSDNDKDLFLSLLSQYGDDFKRIAASMPNKTTIQVSAFYKSNVDELDLERVAAGAPKRSPTPECNHISWKDGSVPGSGVMSPVSARATPVDPALNASTFGDGLVSNHVPSSRKLQIRDLLSGPAPSSEPNMLPHTDTDILGHPHSPLQPRIHPPSNFTRFVTTALPNLGHGMSSRAAYATDPPIFSVEHSSALSHTHHAEVRSPEHQSLLAMQDGGVPGEPLSVMLDVSGTIARPCRSQREAYLHLCTKPTPFFSYAPEPNASQNPFVDAHY